MFVALMQRYNRARYLPRTKRVVEVAVEGGDELLAARRPSDRLLLLPNHPSHADPEVFFEALRQTGISTLFMVAYDIFLRNRRNACIIQRTGGFSVDREGSDPSALKQAKQTLVDGRHALTIFPEGNVYLQNDQVTPFHEGAAMIGLRTARELAERHARILAVPVSIKLTYLQDVRDAVFARLNELASAVEVELREDDPPVERLIQVGVAALHRNLKHRGIDSPREDDLTKLIQAAAGVVLDRLEAKLDQSSREGDSLIDRVRKARRVIHQIRLDDSRAADHAAAAHWADEAMLAFRIASYAGNYVAARPTLDRFAETVEKLSEDVFARMPKPFGDRRATVRFNAPIDLTDYLPAFSRKARDAVRELTRDIEQTVQRGVDAINERNRQPGGTVTVQ